MSCAWHCKCGQDFCLGVISKVIGASVGLCTIIEEQSHVNAILSHRIISARI